MSNALVITTKNKAHLMSKEEEKKESQKDSKVNPLTISSVKIKTTVEKKVSIIKRIKL